MPIRQTIKIFLLLFIVSLIFQGCTQQKSTTDNLFEIDRLKLIKMINEIEGEDYQTSPEDISAIKDLLKEIKVTRIEPTINHQNLLDEEYSSVTSLTLFEVSPDNQLKLKYLEGLSKIEREKLKTEILTMVDRHLKLIRKKIRQHVEEILTNTKWK